MSVLGRKSVLALARQMTASFYAVVSKSATLKPDNIVKEWRGRCGTAAETFDANVHMVIRNCSSMGEPPALVLTATTTVWLQNTPPQLVLEYLCNGDRRGEWDTFAYARAVQELSSVTTCPIRGNAVSILCLSNIADRNNSNMLLLQETASDISCSLVVYSFVEKNMMRAVMDGVNNNPVFLLPSGFAILPDGHGEADLFAASSSNASTSQNHTAGSLLTASYQAMLPSFASNSNQAAVTFDDAGKRVCHAINHILAAVGAYIAKPA